MSLRVPSGTTATELLDPSHRLRTAELIAGDDSSIFFQNLRAFTIQLVVYRAVITSKAQVRNEAPRGPPTHPTSPSPAEVVQTTERFTCK